MRHVVLCDENGNQTGKSNLEEAHKSPGELHLAFSTFVFRNDSKELLVQKRASGKLFGSLWANTCCSHPQENEEIIKSAEKRLKEECGFTCPLSVHSSFIYKADDPNKKGTENEFDTILVSEIDGEVELNPDPNEIDEIKWVNVEELIKDIQNKPEDYCPWFPIALNIVLSNNEERATLRLRSGQASNE